MSPFGLEAPQLSTAHRPNSAGYLGYLDSSQQQALDRHVNREAIEWQPMVLLYNQPAHCDNAGLYQGFMRMERDFRDRRGEYEADWPGGLLRDGSDAQAPFRTRRAPQRYRHAPSRKLIVDQRYSLEDLLDEPGYARTLDGSEETQRVVLFSAIDPATPIGFVVLHRRVALEREHLCVDLFPNFFYVAPPYRGLGYGICLVSATLEIWETELQHQAARFRGRAALRAGIDAGALQNPPGLRLLALLRKHTLATLENCASYWGCEVGLLRVDKD
ncbi:MAG: hypothetical protein KDH88_02975 [Chromatiales bacterium]|nr:hypothetical protein [Chromatiales bacterium]